MAKKAAYVWHGGAKLLHGETYQPGHVFDDEFVMGLHNRTALLSAGIFKIEMVDVGQPKSASTTTTKKKKPTKKKAPKKAAKPETVEEVEARVAEAEEAPEELAPEPEE